METINVVLKEAGAAGRLYASAPEDGNVSFIISGFSENKIELISDYLNKSRKFKIPQSPQIDDYTEMKGKPIDNITFFRLALCTLWANTGIKVEW